MKSFRKLKGKLRASTQDASMGDSSSRQKLCHPHTSESEQHGLFILHPVREVLSKASQIEVDIVAIHGLNGTARKTWLDDTSGKLWLEDFLPEAIPKARIMTYGYDARLAFSRTTAGVENFANDMLNRLRMVRVAPDAQKRPLVFVAHSLGGIVVKKALIMAHEAEVYYGSILKSTVGILFMGTPHRGSELVTWALLLANVINAAFLGQAIRKDLLQELGTGSGTLERISQQFVHRSTALRIMSFIEMRVERPLRDLVVPEYSARMNLPNEMVFPVNAHHRSICRYPSNDDHTYVLVESAIKEIITSNSQFAKSDIEHNSNAAKQTTLTLDTTYTGAIASRLDLGSNSTSTQLASTIRQTTRPAEELITSGNTLDLVAENSTIKTILIRFSALKWKLGTTKGAPRKFSTTLRIPLDSQVQDLRGILLREQPDVLPNFQDFKFPGCSSAIDITWQDVFTLPVKVTSGRPSYSPDQGYKINIDQTIASFFSRAFPNPIQAKLHSYCASSDSRPEPSYTINFGQRNMQYAQMSLLRSHRVPEDGREYDLSPRLGNLPIYDVRSFSEHLPVLMVAQGGLFLPIHEMEAMSIMFDCAPGKNLAIRTFLGGINGISGLSLFKHIPSPGMSPLRGEQDYIVLPGQKRLDGIAIKPGIVRQFVAITSVSQPYSTKRSGLLSMPGSSRKDSPSKNASEIPPAARATIEWQMTGEDAVGGVQIQIIPQYDIARIYAGNIRDVIPQSFGDSRLISYQDPVPESALQFDVLKTPRELGLQENDTIHIKDMNQQQKSRSKLIRDLLDEVANLVNADDILELEAYRALANEATFNIRGAKPLDQISTFQFDRADDFDDIMCFLREEYITPDAVLNMLCPVSNNPSFYFPVFSWNDISRLLDLSKSSSSFRYEGLGINLEFILSLPNRWEEPKRICRVKVQGWCHLSETESNLTFALPNESRISDLRQEIIDLLGIPFRLVQHRTHTIEWECPAKMDFENVFDQENYNTIPDFEILNETNESQIFNKGGIPHGHLRRWKKVVTASSYGIHNMRPDQMIFPHSGFSGGDKPILFVMAFGKKIELDFSKSSGDSIFPNSIAFDFDFYESSNDDVGLINIALLKQKLEREINIRPEQQILTYKGLELANGTAVFPYRFKILYLTIRPNKPTTLGIGAGGTIIQDIKKDESDPRLWDIANSKIIYLFLLEASSCKSIPGLKPPEPPITPSTYTHQGPPLKKSRKSKGKSPAVGAGGAFDSLVGVDAWNRRRNVSSTANGGESTVDAELEVEDYDESGLYVGSQDIVTMDVDDTLPGF